MPTNHLLASVETMQVWVWDLHPLRMSVIARFDISGASWYDTIKGK